MVVFRRLSVVTMAALVALALAAPAGSARAGGQSAIARAVRYKLANGYIPIGGPAAYERYSAAALAKAALLRPSSPGPTTLGQNPVPGPSWQGVDENALAPPDPTGAIGPN